MTPMLTTFSGAALDRAAERRTDEAWLAERLADPASRADAVTEGGGILDGRRLALFGVGELEGEPLLLGVQDGAALFAVAVSAAPGGRALGLRQAAALLAQDEGGLAAYSSA